MKVLLLTDKGFETKDIQDELSEYYKLIECSTIDIVVRKIAGKTYDIICDDEGLFKESPRVTALWNDFTPALVGNLIFAHHDAEGNMTGLTDNEIQDIMQSAMYLCNAEKGMIWQVLILDY